MVIDLNSNYRAAINIMELERRIAKIHGESHWAVRNISLLPLVTALSVLETIRLLSSVVEPFIKGLTNIYLGHYERGFWQIGKCTLYNSVVVIPSLLCSFVILTKFFFREAVGCSNYFEPDRCNYFGSDGQVVYTKEYYGPTLGIELGLYNLKKRLECYDQGFVHKICAEQPVDFTATWEKPLEHLKPLGVAQKVSNFVSNPINGLLYFLSIPIAYIANFAVLPVSYTSSYVEFKEAQETCSFYQPSIARYVIATPDGVKLQVNLLKSKTANVEDVPTVICFQGNGTLSDEIARYTAWIQKETGYNVVTFDYRSVGGSTGNFSSTEDLLVDGHSVVQWVHNYLRTPLDKIHFYGHSLGGAVAAGVQALDPDRLTGRHINVCSLSSTDSFVDSWFGPWIGKRAASLLASVIRLQGYGIDADKAFKSLKGERFVIYHPKDGVIPWEASLQKAVQHDNYLELTPIPMYRKLSDDMHHNASLGWHQGAERRIVKALLGT